MSPSNVQKVLSNVILLSQLDEQKDYECVTVRGKVIRVQDPVKVSPVLRKQNITIADSSAAARLTLWENSINKLSLHKSYRFHYVPTSPRNIYPCHGNEEHLRREQDLGVVTQNDLPDDTVTITNA